MTVTFFGHRVVNKNIREKLKRVVIQLIEAEGANIFYVGNSGAFDMLVKSVLCEIAANYPCIKCSVVLQNLPQSDDNPPFDGGIDTIYPEEVESGPPRFAVCRRNEWMIKQSDMVVSYVEHSFGGAAKYAELSLQRGKRVINLAESD